MENLSTYHRGWRKAVAGMLLAAVTSCSPSVDRAPAETQEASYSQAVYRGSGLARQVCARCHDISTGTAPIEDRGAPSFASVAARPDLSAEELRAWLRSTHPTMPNYIFSESEVEDVVAYILSLHPKN
jgi:mono/diheme cytochrome c family protein